MISQTFAVLVAILGVGVAAPSDPYSAPAPRGYQQESYAPIPYTYNYGVQDEYSGVDFSQNEESYDGGVSGSYTVQLPDGRKQTVTYKADDYNGYVAQVEYYGEAQYAPGPYNVVTFAPQNYGSQKPSYQPPSYQ